MYRLPEADPPVPRFVLRGMVFLVVGVIVLVVLVALNPPDSSIQEGSFEIEQVAEEVTVGQEITVSVSTVTLFMPGDAISVGGVVSITTRPPGLFSIAGETEWYRAQVVYVEFQDNDGRVYPHFTLSKPARICFTLAKNEWQDYTDRPDEFQVQSYAEDQDPPTWEVLPISAYPNRNQLCGETDHFSIFALAVKPKPGTPFTGATPTLIKAPYKP